MFTKLAYPTICEGKDSGNARGNKKDVHYRTCPELFDCKLSALTSGNVLHLNQSMSLAIEQNVKRPNKKQQWLTPQ
eukprot:806322-Amphidinium_carterae.1